MQLLLYPAVPELFMALVVLPAFLCSEDVEVVDVGWWVDELCEGGVLRLFAIEKDVALHDVLSE